MSNLTKKVYINGTVYFSYDTVVGIEYNHQFYLTSEKYSKTTSRHCGIIKREMAGNVHLVNENQLNDLADKVSTQGEFLKTVTMKTR